MRPPTQPCIPAISAAPLRPPSSRTRSAPILKRHRLRKLVRTFVRPRFLEKLYVQVLIGVGAGVAVGIFAPKLGGELKPLGDVFVKLIRMIFAPVIFATVVLGIARMESIKELGRVGLRALFYFEVLSTFALALGLVVVNIVQPGRGMKV